MIQTFTILGAPRTKKTGQRIVRFVNRPAIIQSKLWKEYERNAKGVDKARLDGDPILVKQPIRLHAVFYRERAAGDLTNFLQGLQDLIQVGTPKNPGLGWIGNDSWIIGFTADTRLEKDKDNPRVEGALLTGDDAFTMLAYDLRYMRGEALRR